MPESAQSDHPSMSVLTEFALGKLTSAKRQTVQAHLQMCDPCRHTASELSTIVHLDTNSDTKVSTPEPLREPSTTTRSKSAIPADLANHPRYDVLELLGEGGMGAVYKARHKLMDRLVALKVIRANLLQNAGAIAGFQREVRAAAKLNHPNIVRAHDADEAGTTHFLVMEFVEGTDLAKYVKERGPLPAAHACHFIRHAALGLEHAAQHGLVHRDIKPHNLMLANPTVSSPGATVKVMDFGLAFMSAEASGNTGMIPKDALVGTADYVAPEQAQDPRRADIRSDIYSLGCSLFHLLAGQAPLAGANDIQKLAAHLTGNLPLADLSATVPVGLRDTLAKMVAKDPADRFQTPTEVAAALVPFITSETGVRNAPATAAAARAPAGTEPTVRKKRRPRKSQRGWPLLPIVVGAAAAALLIGTFAIFGSLKRQPAPTIDAVVASTGPTTKQPQEPLLSSFVSKVGMNFVAVPKGKAWLNGGLGSVGGNEVQLDYDFYLGKYEVTQGEWEAVMRNQPSFGARGPSSVVIDANRGSYDDISKEERKQFPVENISWNDAQAFLAELNKSDLQPGWKYRLPTEIEWEYACRGGPMSDQQQSAFDFYFDKPISLAPNPKLKDQQLLDVSHANFRAPLKSLQRTCRVGSYKPNLLGLYDMHGNVSEWCDDSEQGANLGRAYRGGNWSSAAQDIRAASRVVAKGPAVRASFIGFRVARVWVGLGGN